MHPFFVGLAFGMVVYLLGKLNVLGRSATSLLLGVAAGPVFALVIIWEYFEPGMYLP